MEELRRELTDEEVNEVTAGGLKDTIDGALHGLIEALKKNPIKTNLDSTINPGRAILNDDELDSVSGGLEVCLRDKNSMLCETETTPASAELRLRLNSAQVIEPTMVEVGYLPLEN